MALDFIKMHGIGNDFVVVDDLDGALGLTAEHVRALCDRHTGVGADGVIAVQTAPDGGFYMHYVNADGSLAEMCGNGVRCFAKFLADRGLVGADEFTAHTLGGPKPISIVRGPDGSFVAAAVDMGSPVFDPDSIPTTATDPRRIGADTPRGAFEFFAVSMGNPHAVTFVEDAASAPVRDVGPQVEADPRFPAKTNVEFASIDDGRVSLRVWERGVGETLACGTGACATVVAAVESGRIGPGPTVVALPGGDLTIDWRGDGSVMMTGPATEVFRGSIHL